MNNPTPVFTREQQLRMRFHFQMSRSNIYQTIVRCVQVLHVFDRITISHAALIVYGTVSGRLSEMAEMGFITPASIDNKRYYDDRTLGLANHAMPTGWRISVGQKPNLHRYGSQPLKKSSTWPVFMRIWNHFFDHDEMPEWAVGPEPTAAERAKYGPKVQGPRAKSVHPKVVTASGAPEVTVTHETTVTTSSTVSATKRVSSKLKGRK